MLSLVFLVVSSCVIRFAIDALLGGPWREVLVEMLNGAAAGAAVGVAVSTVSDCTHCTQTAWVVTVVDIIVPLFIESFDWSAASCSYAWVDEYR